MSPDPTPNPEKEANVATKIDAKVKNASESFGNLFVNLFHQLALFAIGAATVWAALIAFIGMVEAGHASIQDLLLLFIYLEIGAMVGIYFKTTRMPVRFLIYVAITALTRLLIGEANVHPNDGIALVWISGAILLLAIAALVLRYGSYAYPSDGPTG